MGLKVFAEKKAALMAQKDSLNSILLSQAQKEMVIKSNAEADSATLQGGLNGQVKPHEK